MNEKKVTLPPKAPRSGNKPLAKHLREAVVWSEVLGKPLARRQPRSR